MTILEKVLESEYPELQVNIPTLGGYGDIEEPELREVVRAIKRNGVIEDALTLLDGRGPLKESVTYDIVFPNQKRKVLFKTEFVMGSNIYIGWIITKHPEGAEKVQARLYDFYQRH